MVNRSFQMAMLLLLFSPLLPSSNVWAQGQTRNLGSVGDWEIFGGEGMCFASRPVVLGVFGFAIGVNIYGSFLLLSHDMWNFGEDGELSGPTIVTVDFDGPTDTQTTMAMTAGSQVVATFVFSMAEEFWSAVIASRTMTVTLDFLRSPIELDLANFAVTLPMLTQCVDRYMPDTDLPFSVERPIVPETLTSNESGIGVSELESSTSASELRAAVEDGDLDAQVSLGLAHLTGQGVEQDYEIARELFLAAAGAGHAMAQSNLGVIYSEGLGVIRDYAEAIDWFRMAAEQGLAQAQHNLGVMYREGLGVAQDYEVAVNWIRMAAEQGHGDALVSLGTAYLSGQGVEQDYGEAIGLFRTTAEAGHALAQAKLGAMYLTGLGVAQDLEQAYAWLVTAESQGMSGLDDLLEQALDGMSRRQRRRAEEFAREFHDKFVVD